MTINGPAPIILAMFLNTAIDQQVERHLRNNGDWEKAQQRITKMLGDAPVTYQGDLPEGHSGFGLGLLGVTGDQLVDAETYQRIAAETLNQVRGTVQADILKEDQAQNTCIFSTEFALHLMGDVQAGLSNRTYVTFTASVSVDITLLKQALTRSLNLPLPWPTVLPLLNTTALAAWTLTPLRPT
jgi:methylmalonyl-CoA mutase